MRRTLCAGAALALLVLLPAAAGGGSGVVRFAATGDIAMVASSDDGSGFFSHVSRDLTGDVVWGNLEGTLTTGYSSKCGTTSSNCYSFHAPPSYATVLKHAGFTVMNVANNHAMDYGTFGQSQTLDSLRQVGLKWAGRPGQITYLTIGKVRVAVLGFAPYPWASSLTNIPKAVALVSKAAASADLVVVEIHAGAEGTGHEHVTGGTEYFLGENRGDALHFSHAVIRAGADLVVGSGPHVLRGMEWYDGRLIAYSLGNFLGDGTLSISGEGGISALLQVSLHADGSWAGGRIVPIQLVSPGVPEEDPAGNAIAMVRRLSVEDFGRNGMRISTEGVLLPPG